MDIYRHDDVAFLIESNTDSFHVTGWRLKEELIRGATRLPVEGEK